MISKPTRTLLDAAAAVAIAWMWISVYQFFTHTGLWPIVDHALGHATTLPGQAAVLATCVLVGWLSLATVSWVAWRVLAHRRSDFPTARLRATR